LAGFSERQRPTAVVDFIDRFFLAVVFRWIILFRFGNSPYVAALGTAEEPMISRVVTDIPTYQPLAATEMPVT
jgi:hypothetical protein